MSTPKTPSWIEEAMLMPGYKSVYFIGCLSRGKITIHSQQIRAFNLAYALIQEKNLDSSHHIAVIGGGIAGITVASALAMSGSDIDVFESHQEVLDLQRKSDRYVHPNIFDWPSGDATNTQTNFPFLNWEAAEASKVTDRLYAIWDNLLGYCKNIYVRTSNTVYEVVEICDKDVVFSRVTFNNAIRKHQTKNDETLSYDYVIYAGGYGVEQHERNEFLSYWEKDKYESDVRYIPKRVHIYGTGDGGLIDAVRIALKNFSYQSFVEDFTKYPRFYDLGTRMQKADEEVLAALNSQAVPLSGLKAEEFISRALKNRYDAIFTPDFRPIRDELFKRYHQRRNVKATLYGRTTEPYSLGASLLNRMVVYLLLEAGIIDYWMVGVPNPKYAFFRKVQLYIGRLYNYVAKITVIERLGPERPFKKLFQIKDEEHKKAERLLLGIEPCWPADFFDNSPFLKKPVVYKTKPPGSDKNGPLIL